MSVISGDPFRIEAPKPGGHVIIGYLDGVHLGHQALATYAIEKAEKEGGYPAAFSFNGKLYTKSIPTCGLLTTSEEKCRLLLEFGLEYVFLSEFTDALRDMAPEKFVKVILKERIKVASVAVGPSFSFGKGGKGGPLELGALCLSEGITCKVIPEVAIAGKTVSSSAIRNMLFKGQVEDATMLLGRHYFLTGAVVPGVGVGKKIGFPTANLQIEDPLKLVPGGGVYGCWGIFDGERHVCAVSIGTRPTFLGGDNSLEAHVLDYDGELYGRQMTLEFVFKVRDQKKFESEVDLSAQIAKDIESIRRQLGGTNER